MKRNGRYSFWTAGNNIPRDADASPSKYYDCHIEVINSENIDPSLSRTPSRETLDTTTTATAIVVRNQLDSQYIRDQKGCTIQNTPSVQTSRSSHTGAYVFV